MHRTLKARHPEISLKLIPLSVENRLLRVFEELISLEELQKSADSFKL
jgi:hypothetical protein